MSDISKSPAGFDDDLRFGYCTNVHAGITLEDAKANLERVATQIRATLCPSGRLPVGLWLAHNAAEQLHSDRTIPQFGEWLRERGLKPYTFNGFPQGDFHQPVVKHAVYEPTWLDESRVQYTLQLADILGELIDGSHGSISTLPLGWPHRQWQTNDFQQAGLNLQRVAAHLDQLYQSLGKEIVLAIEPEPGCVIDTATDMVAFLEQFVFDDKRPYIRRHITVCHDICHSAVMFEPQEMALSLYLKQGVRVGKVQVSSAVEVPWHNYAQDNAAGQRTWEQLQRFSEPRYLHQTTRMAVQDATQPDQLEMVDDLPIALDSWLPEAPHAWPTTPWRIHFHVPIFVERFEQLHATRADILTAVQFFETHRDSQVDHSAWFTGDYEVETYAWGVLPPELRVDNLAGGIAKELAYFQSVLKGLAS